MANNIELHEYNLIQSFYIIGVKESNNSTNGYYADIISKYPKEELPYLTIQDEILINHCFPNGIAISKNEIPETNYFLYFDLPNINYICSHNNQTIYFTCFIFNDYIKNNYTQKAMVLSSFYPFNEEYTKLIKILYDKIQENSTIYFGKVIHHMLFTIPMPPPGLFQIKYTFFKNELVFKKPVINKIPFSNIDLKEIVLLFTFKQIHDLIKYITFEVPIIIFCSDQTKLSKIIQGLIQIISPFKIQYNTVGIVPAAYYNIIQYLDNFLIGVNNEYKNVKKYFDIEGKDYLIIEVNIAENNCKFLMKAKNLEKKEYVFDRILKPLQENVINKNSYYSFKDLENITIPIHYMNKLETKLNKMIINNEGKKKKEEELSNEELHHLFYYYFSVSVFKDYNIYLVDNSNNISNIIENYNKVLNKQINICDLFKAKEFLLQFSISCDYNYFAKMIGTKLFLNFLIVNIYPITLEEKLNVVLFNEMIAQKVNKQAIVLFKYPTPFLNSKNFEIKDSKNFEINFDLEKNNQSSSPSKLFKRNISFQNINLDYVNLKIEIDENIKSYYEKYEKECTSLLETCFKDKDNYSKVNHNLKNYIFKLWLKLFTISFWYVDYREKWEKFYLLIKVISSIPKDSTDEIMDKEISYTLINFVNLYGDKEMATLLFQHLIYKDYIIYAYINNKCSNYLKESHYYPKYSYLKRRNFSILNSQKNKKTNINLYTKCPYCKKKNDISETILNPQYGTLGNNQKDKPNLIVKCSFSACRMEIINPTIEIRDNEEMNKQIVLYSPFYLYNELKKINKLNVSEFYKTNTDYFYNIIIYFKLLGLESDFIFPYLCESMNNKFSDDKLSVWRDKSCSFSYLGKKKNNVKYFESFENLSNFKNGDLFFGYHRYNTMDSNQFPNELSLKSYVTKYSYDSKMYK